MPGHKIIRESYWDKILIAAWGQSNGNTSALASGATNPIYRQIYSAVTSVQHQSGGTADPPVWEDTTGALGPVNFQANSRMGLEASLMRGLDARWPNKFVYAHTGLYGSSLNVHWNPAGTYPTTQSTNIFTQWLAQIQSVIQAYDISRIIVVGNQGEGDALGGAGTAWGTTNFPAFVTAVRAALGNVPMVHARVNVGLDTNQYPDAANLYASQTTALSGAIAGVTMVNVDSITQASGKFDGVHYTADGYVDEGNLYLPIVEAALGLS